jgi:glucosamine--fructose-6-phosphate aminotransferase (isomerizing)
MCGIIGIVAKEGNVVPAAVEGLKRLEYRGYDSAGVAAVTQAGEICCVRSKGKISVLENELRREGGGLAGGVCIGHTRWATHGAPTVGNAHPHCREGVAVIHNGIIENFDTLRAALEAKGYAFETETDTEVVPVLLSYYLDQGKTPEQALCAMLGDVEGAFALGVLFRAEPERIYAARQGSPLAVGYGDGAMYIASDSYALAPFTSRISYLEDGDYAVLDASSVRFFDGERRPAARDVRISSATDAAVGKGKYRHYMLKEIHEQPTAISETIHDFYNPVRAKMHFGDLEAFAKGISHVTVVACGTSYYAGMIAKYWLEQIAKIPASIDVASEFRYGGRLLPKEGGAALFVSQSGETADTLAALRYAKKHGQAIVSVVNVPESSMARESDVTLHTYAGPEIGVASTKAFTTQLVVLAGMVLEFARERGSLGKEEYAHIARCLMDIPSRIALALKMEGRIAEIAHLCAGAKHMFYVGRGVSYPLALEGALKMKEISYIHAEGFAAGELKHGPIALIEEGVPVVVIAPGDALLDKTLSNVQEIRARGGEVIAVTDAKGSERLAKLSRHVLVLPDVHPALSPVLFAVPAQLLAYYVALIKGTDIDQPRNLAKSVTVE